MVSFWIRQDQQDTGLPDVFAEGINTWLITAWPLKTHLFRFLPGERSSRAALERLEVRQILLRLPDEEPPHLWYQPA